MTSLWLDRGQAVPVDSFAPEAGYDAVVVGAGITGLATTLLLARSGMTVAVLEARPVGAGTTGNTTAKLALLQGTILSGLRRHYSQKVVSAYGGKPRRAGLAAAALGGKNCSFPARDAYTYSVTEAGSERVRSDPAASRAAGLPGCRAAGLPVEEARDVGQHRRVPGHHCRHPGRAAALGPDHPAPDHITGRGCRRGGAERRRGQNHRGKLGEG